MYGILYHTIYVYFLYDIRDTKLYDRIRSYTIGYEVIRLDTKYDTMTSLPFYI